MRAARIIDGLLPFLLVALGFLAESPALWLACFAFAFLVLSSTVLGGAGAFYLLSRRVGRRIQRPHRGTPPIRREAFETLRSMFIAATLAAWPVSQWQLGHPTGLVVDLRATGASPVVITLATGVGLLVVDAWLYWKHRLLHTRLLFGFHRAHHSFRNPTPFAGFAVTPLEALLTFWPTTLLCFPVLVHWAPLYWPLVLGFIVLNLYLHSGVTFGWVEATLPRVFINTSAHHNIHHSHATANYGEALTVWDVVCRTRLQDRRGAEPA